MTLENIKVKQSILKTIQEIRVLDLKGFKIIIDEKIIKVRK